MSLAQRSLAVVGADYPNRKGPARRFEIALCIPGETVDLVPEPDNPKDELAVAVFSIRGVQLGYLSAERCGWIGAMLRSGRVITAIFQEPTTYGAAIRIAFDSDEPILPTREDSDDSQDWWPDEVYDEF